MTTGTIAAPTHEFMPKIKACLGLHELTEPAEVAERMKALRELHKGSSDGMHQGVPVGEYIDKLRETLGVPMTSTVEDIFEAVESMIAAAIAEHEANMHPEGAVASTAVVADVAASTAAAEPEASVQLKDATVKLTQAKATEASLVLQLNAKTTKVAELEATTVKLLKDLAERDELALADRVTEAFETHKDTQKLTDKHLPQMRVFCKSDRKAFDELYPRVAVVHRHLMRNITGGGDGVSMTTEAGATPPVLPGVKPGETTNDTAVRLMSEDKGLTMGEALTKSLKLHAQGR